MKRKRRVFNVRPMQIYLCLIVCLFLLAGVALSQNSKLKDIVAQKQGLQERYDALLLEEQRISFMLDYVKTDEYMKQYIKEVLGYVAPDDYKFYRE